MLNYFMSPPFSGGITNVRIISGIANCRDRNQSKTAPSQLSKVESAPKCAIFGADISFFAGQGGQDLAPPLGARPAVTSDLRVRALEGSTRSARCRQER